ncbi:TetR family transcriptional regulator (fragment) [Frankia canadensis]|uniref:TetR family transcriptional regulator n=1 Tax=Frankia canadensis TaxID=1836972 RepID=A0A2I2KQF1_9ACTN
MSRRPDETRTRLVDAAERLFAERGIDGVSLREITREAGARNAMALQYHFADRTGIIQAILDKHSPPVEAGRLALLDAYEATDRADLRHLAGALVRPWAAKLGDPAGGREFLRINADIAARPFPADDPPSWTVPTESLLRWRELVEPNLDPTAVLLHRRHTAIAYVAVELGRRPEPRLPGGTP